LFVDFTEEAHIAWEGAYALSRKTLADCEPAHTAIHSSSAAHLEALDYMQQNSRHCGQTWNYI